MGAVVVPLLTHGGTWLLLYVKVTALPGSEHSLGTWVLSALACIVFVVSPSLISSCE